MKLEDQVCSLELAIKLKSLGVEQSSLWYWVKDSWLKEFKLIYTKSGDILPITIYDEEYSAFTVAELGGGLPKAIDVRDITKLCGLYELEITKDWTGNWFVRYATRDYLYWQCAGSTEANARALMRIYLIENGLVKI